MPTRRAARTVARTAVEALLLIVLAGSWPTAAVAAGPAPAPALAPVPAASRALCPPAAPGFMTCDALISTASAPLARGALGPDSTPYGYGPADLLSAYQLPDAASGAGTGMTVAVVDAYDLPSAESDLATYRSQFGLSPCTTANGCFRKVDQNGGTAYPGTDSGWGGETALDIEMVSAICPNCRIVLVEAASENGTDLFVAESQAVSQGAAVISNSWGGTEFYGEQTYDASVFKHPGIAITFSTGDDGYGVQYPAASPWVTAVGGTSLSRAANARGWSETAWGTPAGGAHSGAGSGCSAYEQKPVWQHDSGCSMRTTADVSAVANPATGVAVYSSTNGGWVTFGGTSVASPIIAGVYALDGPAAAGTYPASYPYAKPAQLNDVTSGSNGNCGSSYLCTATTGYDGPTGLGTPISIGAFGTVSWPGAPTSVSAVGSNASATVAWHAAAPNGHPVSAYSVTSAPGGLTCSTSGALSCAVAGLTNGTSYTFKVSATNSIGTGPASTASNSVIPATVPDPPTAVTAVPGDGGVSVGWAAPAVDGGRAITGYTVTAAPGGRSCLTTVALTCDVMQLADGTPYTFTVTATNPVGTSSPSTASPSVTPIALPGATYHVVLPSRLVDSRRALGLAGKLVAGQHQLFQVTGVPLADSSTIPGTAVAITGNLTVTDQTAPGYLSLTPVGTDQPGTSTLNFPLGDVRANGVTVPLGPGGSLGITYMARAGATAQVVFDVTGYFVDDALGATYHPVTPNRVADSRTPSGLSSRLSANTGATFAVTGLHPADSTQNVPGGAIAVTGNLTVTGQTAPGYFSLTPSISDVPGTSTLNFPLADTRANGVTVPLAPDGSLAITYVAKAGSTAQAVFDVTGYFFADAGGATYHVVNPNRLVDSRIPSGLAGHLVSGAPQTFNVANRADALARNIPADASAITGNLTVTGQTAAGYLSLTPVATNLPSTSTLNFPFGDVRANGLTTTLGSLQTLSLVYMAGAGQTADVVFDVSGYFAP